MCIVTFEVDVITKVCSLLGKFKWVAWTHTVEIKWKTEDTECSAGRGWRDMSSILNCNMRNLSIARKHFYVENKPEYSSLKKVKGMTFSNLAGTATLDYICCLLQIICSVKSVLSTHILYVSAGRCLFVSVCVVWCPFNSVCVYCVVTSGANSEMDGSWQADSVVQWGKVPVNCLSSAVQSYNSSGSRWHCACQRE